MARAHLAARWLLRIFLAYRPGCAHRLAALAVAQMLVNRRQGGDLPHRRALAGMAIVFFNSYHVIALCKNIVGALLFGIGTRAASTACFDVVRARRALRQAAGAWRVAIQKGATCRGKDEASALSQDRCRPCRYIHCCLQNFGCGMGRALFMPCSRKSHNR